MKHVLSVCVFVFFSICLFGQTEESGAHTLPDSIKIISMEDTLRVDEKELPLILQSDSVIAADTTEHILPDPVDLIIRQKTDSIARTLPNDSITIPEIKPLFKPNPKKAVIYSAIFPGLGQIYNRKYWKLPILYGFFTGFAYAISWNHGHYKDYMGGYIDIVDDDPGTNRWEKFIPYGQTAETVDKSWLSNALRDRKNYFRYYRDLSIIGVVAVYGLAIVDAYVDAQLFDFDISPDLSMRVEPAILKRGGSGLPGNAYGIQWSFSF